VYLEEMTTRKDPSFQQPSIQILNEL